MYARAFWFAKNMCKKQFLILVIVFVTTFNLVLFDDSNLMALDPSANSGNAEVEGSKEDMETRVEERKKEFGQQIVNSHTLDNCESAQVKLGLIRTQSTEISKSQLNKYEEVINRLIEMKSKLIQKNLDNQELNKSIEELKILRNSINGGFTEYLISLDDTRNIDCVDDQQGFLVSLAEARKSLADIKRLHVEFRVTVDRITKETLPRLKELVFKEAVQDIKS